MQNNKLFLVSIGLLLSTLFILIILLYITRNAVSVLSIQQTVGVWSLASVLLLLPEVSKKKSLFIFVALIVLLPLIGIFTSNGVYFSVALAVFSWSGNYKNFKTINLNYLIYSFLTSIFFIALTYSSSAQILSPVFSEIIINGKAVPDTLFHAAVSNSILMEQKISTRIYGSPTFSYHWFSHYVYAGFSELSNLKNIEFYNWAYPCLIIPLFIKYLYNLLAEAFVYFKINANKAIIFFPALLLSFSFF